MIQPTKDYIIIEAPEKGATKTKTGIYLPEKKSEVCQTGVVIGGEGYKKGDEIWFRKWAGEEITYNKKKYLFIHRKDIIGFSGK